MPARPVENYQTVQWWADSELFAGVPGTNSSLRISFRFIHNRSKLQNLVASNGKTDPHALLLRKGDKKAGTKASYLSVPPRMMQKKAQENALWVNNYDLEVAPFEHTQPSASVFGESLWVVTKGKGEQPCEEVDKWAAALHAARGVSQDPSHCTISVLQNLGKLIKHAQISHSDVTAANECIDRVATMFNLPLLDVYGITQASKSGFHWAEAQSLRDLWKQRLGKLLSSEGNRKC